MSRTISVEELGYERLSPRDKGIPTRAFGLTVREFLATEPRLGEFWTPIVALDDEAIENNLTLMAEWSRSRRLRLMPHGKTTMAPALWLRQIEAGSLGITLATMGQVRTARSFGVDSIMLANAVVDPRSLRYLAAELVDPAFRFVCWADSVATIEAMEDALRAADTPRRVDVCVELGAVGGRTGARTLTEAIQVATRAAASDVIRLAGVAGYEGALAHDRAESSLEAVQTYIRRQVELHHRLGDLYDGEGDIYVTAGGSAYFDVVADEYTEAMSADDRRTLWTLRSGAYLTHDDGFYRRISPLDEGREPDAAASPRLRSAIRGIARVVSHPEARLALLDGGKRDFPFDEGLPIPRQVAGDLDGEWSALRDASIIAMNDQHSYLRLGDEDVALGSVVALGLSHPCTTFDKWRLLPVVASQDDDRVVDLVRTFF